MKQGRKLGKKMAAWVICLAMMLATVDLPAFTTVIKAEDSGTEDTNINIDIDVEIPMGDHRLKYSSEDNKYHCSHCTDSFNPGGYNASFEKINDSGTTDFHVVYALYGDLTSYSGSFEFNFCDNLTTVDLGSLTSYSEDFGFGACKNLMTVNLGSLTSYSDSFGFGVCKNLMTVDLGSLTSYSEYFGFDHCANLTTVDLGSLTSYSEYFGFDYCANLTTVDLGSLTSYSEDFGFGHCSNLTTVDLGSLTSYSKDFGFDHCANLTTVDLGSLTSYSEDFGFCVCKNLMTVDLGSLTSYSEYFGFGVCKNLTTVDLGSLTSYSEGFGFGVCKNLTTVDLGSLTSYSEDFGFGNCSNLTTVVFHQGYSYGYDSAEYIKYRNHDFKDNDGNDAGNCKVCGICKAVATSEAHDYTDNDGNKAGNCKVCGICKSVATKGTHIFLNTATGKYQATCVDCNVANTQKCGENAYWVMDSEGVLHIYGSGAMTDYNYSGENVKYAPWHSIKSTVKGVVVEAGITNIGNYSFHSCSNLESADLPSGVTNIGGSAFYMCTSLKSINLPSEVTSIGESAFGGCSSLERIELPSGVTSIEENAFCGCSSLASVAMMGDVTSIGKQAFSRCSSLASVAMMKDVTSIGEQAFSRCSSLASVAMMGDVTSIGEQAFSGCSSELIFYVGCETEMDKNEYLKSVSKGIIKDHYFKDASGNDVARCQCCDGCKSLIENLLHDYEGQDKDNTIILLPDVKSCICGRKNIGYKDIEINITNPDYNGSVRKPTIEIKDGTKTFLEDIDYEILYDYDTEDATNVGEDQYKLFINGMNEYDGTLTRYWNYNRINPVVADLSYSAPSSFVYDGSEKVASVVAKDGITGLGIIHVLYQLVDEKNPNTEKRSLAPTDAGTYKVYADVEAGQNYNKTSSPLQVGEFTILRTDASITVTPSFHKTYGDAAFSLGATKTGDGTLSYTSNKEDVVTVDASGLVTIVGDGEATITVSMEATGNYKAAESKTVTINVDKALLLEGKDYEIPTNLKANCGDKLSNVAFEDTMFSWKDGTAVLEAGDLEAGANVSCKAIVKKAHFIDKEVDVNIAVTHKFSATHIDGTETHVSQCSVCKKTYNVVDCSGGEATCSSKAICSVCGAAYGSFDSAAHRFATYVEQNDATCIALGHKVAVCEYGCGAQDAKEIPDSYGEHKYVNGVCSVCNEIFKTTIDGITYQAVTTVDETTGKPVGQLITVSENEVPKVQVSVVSVDADASANVAGKVALPSEITSEKADASFVVTKIEENAFVNAVVTEVVVPSSITEVGENAFGSADTVSFMGTVAPIGVADAIKTDVIIKVPDGSADSYKEQLGEEAKIEERHTHTFEIVWTYDEQYHWHKATCGHAEEIADKAEHAFGEWTTVSEATEEAEGAKERTCACGYKETESIPKKEAQQTPNPSADPSAVPSTDPSAVPSTDPSAVPSTDPSTVPSTASSADPSAVPSTASSADPSAVPSTASSADPSAVPSTASSAVPSIDPSAVPSTAPSTMPSSVPSSNPGVTESPVPSKIPEAPEKGEEVRDDKTGAVVEVTNPEKKEVSYKASSDTKTKTVSVPSTITINGQTYKVTEIAKKAFKNNKTLTKATIPSSVTQIGESAFLGCKNLKTVSIPKNVTKIESSAFKGCSSLTKLTIPSKVTKIGSNAFNGCKKLGTLTIKSTKLTNKSVSKNAFKGLSKSTVIKVPKKKLKEYQKLFKSKGFLGKVKA